MQTINQKRQPDFRIRMMLGMLFYPITFIVLFCVPDFGERSEDVLKSFVVALVSGLSCAALVPIIRYSPRKQKKAALCLLLIPICAGFYALGNLGYYFLVEMKYNHRNLFLLKWLKLP